MHYVYCVTFRDCPDAHHYDKQIKHFPAILFHVYCRWVTETT